MKRASLKKRPRLFHSMRASRETELARHFPIHVVTAWLGNTPRFALKHYLTVIDADFERAAGATEGGGRRMRRTQRTKCTAAGTCDEWQRVAQIERNPCWRPSYCYSTRYATFYG